MVGKTILHYEVLERLGEGGMGVVYKARDTRLKRLVALKVLAPERASNSVNAKRFLSEARAASALNHPNIITIHDIEEFEGSSVLVMEYLDGRSLDRLIPAAGMKIADVLRYGVQIADALGKAHSAGIVHRDLKPANIMVLGDGRVKLLDFGLAKATVDAPQGPLTTGQLTEPGFVMGTVCYMSPEQAEGKNLDARSDIFSFGILLYEMLTGKRPFGGDSAVATMSSILRDDPAPLRQARKELPAGIEEICRLCLEKDAARRYQDGHELSRALRLLQVENDPLLPVPPAVVVTKAKAPAWAWVAAVALLLLIVGGSAWWLLSGKGKWAPAPGQEAPNAAASGTGSGVPSPAPAAAVEPGAAPAPADAAVEARLSPRNFVLQRMDLKGPNPALAPFLKEPLDSAWPSYSSKGQVAFSGIRDGKHGIFVSDAEGDVVALWLEMEGVRSPQWAPDATTIAFFRSDGLYTQSRRGAKPDLVTKQAGITSICWSLDGKSLYFTLPSGIWKVGATGGSVTQVVARGDSPQEVPGQLLFRRGDDIISISPGSKRELPVRRQKGLQTYLVRGATYYYTAYDAAQRRMFLYSFKEAGLGVPSQRVQLAELGANAGPGLAVSSDERYVMLPAGR